MPQPSPAPAHQPPRPVYIAGIAHALGSRTVSNADLLGDFTEWTAADVEKRVGIRTRQWAGDDENHVTLAAQAVNKLREIYDLDAAGVSAILCSTGNGYQFSPSIACELVTELFPDARDHRLQALDINAACTGYLYALQQAYDMLQYVTDDHGKGGGVLIVTCEIISRFLNRRDPNTVFLFGDGATATYVTTDPAMLNGGGFILHRPVVSALPDPDRALEVPLPGADRYLTMDGIVVARQASRAMAELLDRASVARALKPTDLDWIVPHQASKRVIDSVVWRAGVDPARVITTLAHTGNTSSSSIPICLSNPDLSFAPGQHVGLAAFGAGFTAGAAVLDVFTP